MSEVALHSLQAHQSNGAKDAKDSSHDKENDRSRAAAPRGEGAARGVKAGTFEVCLKGEWRQYYVKVSDKAMQASAHAGPTDAPPAPCAPGAGVC